MKPALSVIVPVYNVAAYLPECLASLQNQTFRNFEAILVDDGSTDGSGEGLDTLAMQDGRFRVLHQANAGQAAARNRAVAVAETELLCFVDSDDLLREDALEKLMALRELHHADIAIMGNQSFEAGPPDLLDPPFTVKEYTGREAVEEQLYQQRWDAEPWARLVPKALFLSAPFPEGKIFEDLAVTWRWLAEAARVVYSPEPIYLYRLRPASTMTAAFSARRLDQLWAARLLLDGVTAFDASLRPAALCRVFSACCQTLLWLPRHAYPEERRAIHAFLNENAAAVARDTHARRKNRAAAMIWRIAGETGLRIAAR